VKSLGGFGLVPSFGSCLDTFSWVQFQFGFSLIWFISRFGLDLFRYRFHFGKLLISSGLNFSNLTVCLRQFVFGSDSVELGFL